MTASELHATRLQLLRKVANFGSSRSAPAMEARKRLKAVTHELLRRETT